jgi:AcrR family transcriptional regulator
MSTKKTRTTESPAQTKAKLIDGAISTLRSHGIAGVSARTIANAAEVNQALVFYHFGSVNNLISAACRENTTARVGLYLPQLAEVKSLSELMAVGRVIHESEKDAGNVKVLAQVLAGAQQDAALAEAAREALQILIEALQEVLDRVLANSVLAGFVDTTAMTEALAASFIGLELYDGIKDSSSGDVFGALEPVVAIAELVDGLNVMSRKAIRARIRRAQNIHKAVRK